MAEKNKIEKVSQETLELFEKHRLSREDVVENLKQDYTPEAIQKCLKDLSFSWL